MVTVSRSAVEGAGDREAQEMRTIKVTQRKLFGGDDVFFYFYGFTAVYICENIKLYILNVQFTVCQLYVSKAVK